MSDESDAIDIEIEDGPGDAVDSANAATADDASSDASEPEGETALESIVSRVGAVDEELATVVQERVQRLREERDEAREQAEALEEEVEDLEDRLKRTQADFQNYKKRAKKRQESIQERATEDLVERLVPVRDNLQRALDQDEDADIRGGVESTLEELDRVLEEENVETIEPQPGDEVDPKRHEVLMRVESDQPAERIAERYRAGYEMGGKVLREAQVTVSDGSGE